MGTVALNSSTLDYLTCVVSKLLCVPRANALPGMATVVPHLGGLKKPIHKLNHRVWRHLCKAWVSTFRFLDTSHIAAITDYPSPLPTPFPRTSRIIESRVMEMTSILLIRGGDHETPVPYGLSPFLGSWIWSHYVPRPYDANPGPRVSHCGLASMRQLSLDT